jgi:signal transduction histidine kinase
MATPFEDLRVLRGLSWPLIGLTVVAGILLALPSEPLLGAGWVAPVTYGLPLGLATWLRASFPWLALSTMVGLCVLLLATVLCALWPSPRGVKAGLAVAVAAGSLIVCALFAIGDVPFRRGKFPTYELAVELITWGFAAATWYAVVYARLLTWKGLALLFVFCIINTVRSKVAVWEAHEDVFLATIAGALIMCAAALPIVFAVVAAVGRFPDTGTRQYRALALWVLGATAIGALLIRTIDTGGNLVDWNHSYPISHALRSYQAAFLRLGLLGALFAVVYAYYRNERSAAAAIQESEAEQSRLDAQVDEARLQVLQAQIEPHFLFNTLAHVKRLYQTDRHAARAMLDNLLRYLTIALPQMRASDSTVAREMELAQAYLEIQRIRMGQRLSFDVNLPNRLRSARLPPMMLLTLVENAIKHGLSPLPEGGSIRIEARADSKSLELKVADTGRGFVASSGGGTGLANIRARLTGLYGSAGRLSFKANAPRGVTASIAVPFALVTEETLPS